MLFPAMLFYMTIAILAMSRSEYLSARAGTYIRTEGGTYWKPEYSPQSCNHKHGGAYVPKPMVELLGAA